jgi:hypothetical protein
MPKGRRVTGLTVENAAAALRAENGIIMYAAKRLKVDRMTLSRYMEKHPELQEVREEASEVLVDIAERHLEKNIKAGEMKTIRWYLDRKGKNRGYATRVEQTGPDGRPLEFETIERRIVDPAPQEEED